MLAIEDDGLSASAPKYEKAFVEIIAKYEKPADEDPRIALTAELKALKPSQRKKQALAAGATEDEIDEAADADDAVAAFVELLLKKQKPAKQQAESKTPHFGEHSVPTPAPGVRSVFGSKHCMFSYQWDSQEEVKQARQDMTKLGVPCWMDTSGGMQSDIYDSMAEGVQNAAVMVCFMTPAYQDSKNCALELKFAAQIGVPIVPVMLQEDFAASGWLGILTAGLLWTRLWDPSTHAEDIESLMQQVLKAADPEAEDGDAVGTESIDEVKGELLRLREDTDKSAPTPGGAASSSRASLPALVPGLPAGILVTPEMEDLLSKLLSSASPRVGFCGM